MKKRWKQLTALVLTAAALLPTAQAAHDHPGTSSSEDDNYVYSAWAKEEAQRAEAEGFTVSSNYGDYTTPISRNDFRYGAMSYVMVNQDQAFLPELVEYYLAEKDAAGLSGQNGRYGVHQRNGPGQLHCLLPGSGRGAQPRPF